MLRDIRFYVAPKTQHGTVLPGVAHEARAEEVRDELMARLEGQAAAGGESICDVPDLKWLTPPGKFEVKFQKTVFTLHGRSSDFNVEYSNVQRIFYVPTVRTEAYMIFQI